MAAKYQLITELYQRTGAAVSRNPQAWQSFLSSACRNYKCRFDEQLLIFAQRPDATAVTTLETWNRQFKRWVNKDSRGIAVFDTKGRRNTLKYYFDVSDTHEGYYNSRPVPIWQMNERYEQAVIERLSDRFGNLESGDLGEALMQTAKNAVEDNLPDYLAQLKECTKDSFLEELDDFNVEVIYKRLAVNSVAFMLMSRCGLDTGEYFEIEDFSDIINFNTPATINAIGLAASDISEMALREISQTVRNVQISERSQNRTFAQPAPKQYDVGRKQPERSNDNERNHLHETGGLPYSRPNITDRARTSAWQIRYDAQELSGAEQASDLSQSADIGETLRTSLPDRTDRTPEIGASDEAALRGTGRDGGAERESTDAVGRNDEQYSQSSGGGHFDRTDLQVSIANEDEVRANLPTVDEQIEMMVEAEEEKSSAFSVSQEDIDSVLVRGSNIQDSKYRIYRQFWKQEDSKKNIEFLKKEYGIGGGTHFYPDGTQGGAWFSGKGIAIEKHGSYTEPDVILSWSKVEKRLRELIVKNKCYLNPKEEEHYPDYLEKVEAPQYEIDTQRKIQRQNFINAKRDLPPADKRDTLASRLSDFIRDLDGYEKALLSNVERTDLSDVTAEQMEQHLSAPATVQQLIDFLKLVQGKTSDVYSRSNAWRFGQELLELHPLHYLYQEGDVVYIGADKYEVVTISEDSVSLQNVEFPLFGKEFSRDDLEEKLKENAANDHLKVVVTEKQKTETLSEKKPDSLTFSIGFSEHPAFYDKEFNDRFTNLSFALGNKLLGVLDEKQHREREGDKNIGWYHKTDFEISAVFDSEDFHYDGRFDIGDGEGDLIAHIKNYYDYCLSPNCPFIPEWKKQGEDYYREKMESLRFGREQFIPYLEQHTELTKEDETLLAEIMATESEWFRVPEEAEQSEDKPRFTVEQTSDAFDEPFIIRDNNVVSDTQDGRYYDIDGIYQTFNSEEEAQAVADTLNSAEAPAPAMEQTDDLIGKEITLDNRRYVIESVGKISGDVSMRDITFQNEAGFPINRVEKLPRVREWLKAQEQAESLPEKEKAPAVTSDRSNYRITEDTLGIGGAKEKFKANMAAVNLLHDLEIEDRLATPEEQKILAGYVGWGGLSMAFDENNAAWANEFKELYVTLSPEEYRAAKESTLTAFYTPPIVIKAMYEALDRLGFSEGNILEPSCGTGNFFGLLPDSMEKSKLHGVEIDSLTGRIAKQLYQKANIAIEGFEKTKLPDDYFDVVLGNVPFGDFRVNDSRYNAQNFRIHDYFFAKALDKARAGGVVMFITSKGTMDKASPEVRKYIAQRAELLGAVRLPDNTFRANAGTEVVSDILVLQKRDRVLDIEPNWVQLDNTEDGIRMNKYFVDNPDMVLGNMEMVSGRFGPESTCIPYEDRSLEELLDVAVKNIQGHITEVQIGDEFEEDLSIPVLPDVRNFSYTVVDGKIYFRENSRMTPANVSATAENRIRGMIALRDTVRSLITMQEKDYSEEEIKSEQLRLNSLYDKFIKDYGLISSRGNKSAFSQDSSYSLLSALEILDENGNLERKADMFTKRTIKPHKEITSVDTSSEALAVSIGEKANVDIEYMKSLTGKSEDEIYSELQGVIFLNPIFSPNRNEPKYLPADEYLSGNVREKLRTAKENAEIYPELYTVNVKYLEKVQPKDLTASEISVRLGATWIPSKYIQEFVFELLEPSQYTRPFIKVHYFEYTGEWNIEGKSYDKGNVKAKNTYGSVRANAYNIIESTLNQKTVKVFDYFEEDGKRKAVLNKKETSVAQAKQKLIEQAFEEWIWKSPERREELCKIYNERFNSIRPREYDGSHINFYGMNPEIKLRPHQINAIAHIMYGGNTLLAHTVGAGKTFEMVAAAQESKRLGLCNKSLFVVPNHLTEQWASEYLQLYPAANILVATKKDFETKNRKKFCARIATGDYDAVIIGHSQFEKIPMAIERQRDILQRQIDELIEGIAQLKSENGERFSIKQLEKSKKSIESKLKKLNDQSRKDDVVTFEELGVDRIFIDESHYYKNLYLYTKMTNVGGIAQTEAQKSSDLFMKTQYLDEITGGRGVIFATGTPISNSMVELYTIQRYLQYGTLRSMNLQHFDSWASTFGQTVTAVELTPEGYTLIGR